MPQTITLTLPDELYEPVYRTAQTIARPLESVLLSALQTSLPTLEGLPLHVTTNLADLEVLDHQALQQVLLETVPADQQEALEALLYKNQADALSHHEQTQLTTLQDQADLVMLRKARAAVLLRFRGQRLPTLAELRRLTIDPAGEA